MPLSTAPSQPARATTGVTGLDDVLGGGLPRGHLYLVEGSPGAGKTTLGLQFLLEGRKRGESGLYVPFPRRARSSTWWRARTAGAWTGSRSSNW